jgi:predicted enzyme related to lactoylglutathione lyase
MTDGMKTIIYPVKDITKATAFYSKLLGVPPAMEAAYYVQFEVAGQRLGLDPGGHDKGMTGPLGYWHVDDIEDRVETLVDAGAEVQQAITDVGGGTLIASVKDADGNVTGLLQLP